MRELVPGRQLGVYYPGLYCIDIIASQIILTGSLIFIIVFACLLFLSILIPHPHRWTLINIYLNIQGKHILHHSIHIALYGGPIPGLAHLFLLNHELLLLLIIVFIVCIIGLFVNKYLAALFIIIFTIVIDIVGSFHYICIGLLLDWRRIHCGSI